ncbi:hypothetical protein [Brucella pseudogrignonensis]|uniref:hypothetical protein n=1 Tax=Brucella pseudogrignonensis TaxID=419475 RepID=UPI000AE5681F|nr:hypothetical protein [Brucella pseudogrignonensis]
MEARVTKLFYGLPDGDVYPREIEVGEIVTGDLAKVALAEDWAVPVLEAKGKRRGGDT